MFYGLNWKVEIGKENTCKLCSISLPSVGITFTAPKEDIEKLLADFRLKFMRAGG